jgi:hypothetical protein
MTSLSVEVPSFADTTEIITLAKAYNDKPKDEETLYYMVKNKIISIEQVSDYLENVLHVAPNTSDFKYQLNPYVYAKYKVVAYTNIQAINDEKAGLTISGEAKFDKGTEETEYRYLGYKVDGDSKITNDFFPADSKTVSLATSRHWIENDPNLKSWNGYKKNENENMLNYLLKQDLQNDDDKNGVFKDVTYSVSSLTGKTEYDDLMKYPILMQSPDFGSVGQMQLAHISKGKKWYDTVRKEAFSFNLTSEILADKPHQYVTPNEGIVEIPYTIKSQITNLVTDNLSQDGHYFSEVKINSITSSKPFKNSDGKDIPLSDLTETRTKLYDTSGMLPGEKKTIKLESSTIVETQSLATYTSTATKNIVLEMVNTDTTDFVIKRNLTDVTDSSTKLDNLDFTTPLTLTLDCESIVLTGNITGRLWEVKNNGVWETIDTGNNEIITYDINSLTKDLLVEGKIEFRLTLVTDSGIPQVRQASHFTKFEEKDDGHSGDLVAVETSDADYDEDEDEYTVMEGEELWLKGYKSYHLNNLDIVDYDFDIGEDEGDAILIDKRDTKVRVFYPNAYGETVFKPKLTIKDEVGATDSDKIRVRVLPAEFIPKIIMNGTFKENRKLHFKVKNDLSRLKYYPIDKGSLRWTITPLDGQGDSIRIDGTANGHDEFDLLFKKKGRYSVTVSGYIESNYNSNRYYGEKTEIITIAEDKKPITDFSTTNIMLRDVEKGNQTLLVLTDVSESIDDDYIVQRIWSYKFDSDNDQDYEDEERVILSVANEKVVELLTENQVGRYKFELQVKEEFGQETIPVFITDLDKRRGDTAAKALDKKVVLIKNVAPIVELDVTKKKPVNVLIYDDFDPLQQHEIEEAVNQLQIDLLEKKLSLNVEYVEPTINIGSKNKNTVYYDTYIQFGVICDGWDEDHDDIWKVETIKIPLTTFKTDGVLAPSQSQVGRFEFISYSVENERTCNISYDNGYKVKFFQHYIPIKLTFKDNGVLRHTTFNFCTDYESWSHRSNWETGFTYREKEFKVTSPRIVVDQAVTERTFYNKTNVMYGEDDDPLLTTDFGRTFETGTKDLLVFDKTEVMDKLQAMEGDTYFVSLLKDKDALLGLDDGIVNYALNNKVKYRSGEDGFLQNNILNFKGLTSVEVRGGKIHLIAGEEVYLFDDANNMFLYYGRASDFYGDALPSFKVKAYVPSENGTRSEKLSYWCEENNRRFRSKTEIDYHDDNRNMGNHPFDYITSNYATYGNAYTYTPYLYRGKLYSVGVEYRANYDWIDPSSDAWDKIDLSQNDFYYDDDGGKLISSTGYVGQWGKDAWLTGDGKLHIFGDYWYGKKISNGRESVEGKKRDYYRYEKEWEINHGMRRIMTIDEGNNNISFIKTSSDYYYVYTKDKKLARYAKSNGKRTLITDGWEHIDIDSEIVTLSNTSFSYRDRQFDDVREIAVYNDTVYSLGANGTLYCDGAKQVSDIKDLVGVDQKGLVYLRNDGVLVYPNGTLSNVASAAYNDNYLFVIFDDGVMKYASNNTFSFSGDVSKTGINFTATDFDTSMLTSSMKFINASADNQHFTTTQATLKSIYEDYKDYSTSDKLYILLDEEVNMAATMFDYESDPYYDFRMDSEHLDPNYFENSLGRDPNVGLGKFLDTFNYVGHYRATPRVRDNPVGEDDRFDDFRLWNQDNTFLDIFVHRRPVAKMTYVFMEKENGTSLLVRDSGSYDLDHESAADKGIVDWKWSLKKEDDIHWQDYKGKKMTIEGLSSGAKYILSYQVKDREGVWSLPIVESFVVNGEPIYLKGKVKSGKTPYTKNNMPITESLVLYDIETRYSKPLKLEVGLYDGDDLVSVLKTVAFEEGVTAKTLDSDLGVVAWSDQVLQVPRVVDGPYDLRLRAVEVGAANKSQTLGFDVGVLTPIDPVPKVEEVFIIGQETEIKCRTSAYTDGVKVVLYKGSAHEEVHEMNFAQSLVTAEGLSCFEWTFDHEVPEPLSPGAYTLSFIGRVETSPEKREVVEVDIDVIDLAFENVLLNGDWNHWRGQVDLLGKQLVDMPYRFLSWENVHLKAYTLGNPDKVTMRLSPELEAMSFTDGNGKTFTYQESFGKTVDFPLEFTKEEDNLWTCDYILPLAPSTMSWEDDRLREAYEIIVTAHKNGRTATFKFCQEEGNEIEITGNTTNLIYVQPGR